MNILTLRVGSQHRYQHSAGNFKLRTLIGLPLISSSLIIQIWQPSQLSIFFPPGFVGLASSCLLLSPPLQHISSRRHKDRAAGKPAKPKFCPYTPPQRHQSFQAVSTLLHLLSALIVFVYTRCLSRACRPEQSALHFQWDKLSAPGLQIKTLVCERLQAFNFAGRGTLEPPVNKGSAALFLWHT